MLSGTIAKCLAFERVVPTPYESLETIKVSKSVCGTWQLNVRDAQGTEDTVGFRTHRHFELPVVPSLQWWRFSYDTPWFLCVQGKLGVSCDRPWWLPVLLWAHNLHGRLYHCFSVVQLTVWLF